MLKLLGGLAAVLSLHLGALATPGSQSPASLSPISGSNLPPGVADRVHGPIHALPFLHFRCSEPTTSSGNVTIPAAAVLGMPVDGTVWRINQDSQVLHISSEMPKVAPEGGSGGEGSLKGRVEAFSEIPSSASILVPRVASKLTINLTLPLGFSHGAHGEKTGLSGSWGEAHGGLRKGKEGWKLAPSGSLPRELTVHLWGVCSPGEASPVLETSVGGASPTTAEWVDLCEVADMGSFSVALHPTAPHFMGICTTISRHSEGLTAPPGIPGPSHPREVAKRDEAGNADEAEVSDDTYLFVSHGTLCNNSVINIPLCPWSIYGVLGLLLCCCICCISLWFKNRRARKRTAALEADLPNVELHDVQPKDGGLARRASSKRMVASRGGSKSGPQIADPHAAVGADHLKYSGQRVNLSHSKSAHQLHPKSSSYYQQPQQPLNQPVPQHLKAQRSFGALHQYQQQHLQQQHQMSQGGTYHHQRSLSNQQQQYNNGGTASGHGYSRPQQAYGSLNATTGAHYYQQAQQQQQQQQHTQQQHTQQQHTQQQHTQEQQIQAGRAPSYSDLVAHQRSGAMLSPPAPMAHQAPQGQGGGYRAPSPGFGTQDGYSSYGGNQRLLPAPAGSQQIQHHQHSSSDHMSPAALQPLPLPSIYTSETQAGLGAPAMAGDFVSNAQFTSAGLPAAPEYGSQRAQQGTLSQYGSMNGGYQPQHTHHVANPADRTHLIPAAPLQEPSRRPRSQEPGADGRHRSHTRDPSYDSDGSVTTVGALARKKRGGSSSNGKAKWNYDPNLGKMVQEGGQEMTNNGGGARPSATQPSPQGYGVIQDQGSSGYGNPPRPRRSYSKSPAISRNHSQEFQYPGGGGAPHQRQY